MITIGIVLSLTALCILSWGTARTQPTAAASAFTALLQTTRSIAADNNGTGSGAVLVVSGASDGSRLTVLTNRPLPGYDTPIATAHLQPITLSIPITIDNGSTNAFSLAISPSGALDVVRSALLPGAAAITSAPGCSNEKATTLTVTFGTAPRTASLQINCNDSTISATNNDLLLQS